ncbi:glycoside hydrolase family 32 protein [Streptomyces cavernae]|uniref:glycoside hydrolase family 32 protein n=1 Tax=Streptomyces cavernae TaxID=2259034 RepID=UPI000FEBBC86
MSTAPRDPHRPVAHLRPPRNWINDPNGLVFHDGYYHVFHQYNPHGATHAHMHWGHFRSTDLLTWEPLPIALSPTPNGVDADGCFSGNAVSDGDRLIAFYSAYRQDRHPRHQPITTAGSRDGGRTFRSRGQLLIPEPPEGCTMWRDLYVWQHTDGWRMLVGAALADGRGAALLYASPDLETWTYLGPFTAREPEPIAGSGLDTGEGWECPQYLPAGSGRGPVLARSPAATSGRVAEHCRYAGAVTEGPIRRRRFGHDPQPNPAVEPHQREVVGYRPPRSGAGRDFTHPYSAPCVLPQRGGCPYGSRTVSAKRA